MNTTPLIPLHVRALERLREQRSRDAYGLLGRDFLADDPALVALGLTSTQALRPLIERELTAEGDLIPFHVRLTDFEQACLALGVTPATSIDPLEQQRLLLEAAGSATPGDQNP